MTVKHKYLQVMTRNIWKK